MIVQEYIMVKRANSVENCICTFGCRKSMKIPVIVVLEKLRGARGFLPVLTAGSTHDDNISYVVATVPG